MDSETATPEIEPLWQQVWRELVGAVADHEHGFHWPVVATVGADGAPEARVCVLRSASEQHGRLTFHTDRRSPKIAQLDADPRLAMTLHCGRRKLQLRARGRASVHRDGELFEAGWSRIGAGSKRCYLAPHAPSTPSDAHSANLPDHLIGRVPDAAEVEAGRKQFAVVALSIEVLDLLLLARDGHRRARFSLADGARSESVWLQP